MKAIDTFTLNLCLIIHLLLKRPMLARHCSRPLPGGLGCCPFQGGDSVVVDFLFIVSPILGVCNCSMFCCTLLYVHFSIVIILMGKRELLALLNLSSFPDVS